MTASARSIWLVASIQGKEHDEITFYVIFAHLGQMCCSCDLSHSRDAEQDRGAGVVSERARTAAPLIGRAKLLADQQVQFAVAIGSGCPGGR